MRLIPTSTLKPVDLKPYTMAVVDDDLVTARLVADVLRASGVGQVHQASDGAEALAQLKDWRADILFLDWRMPKLDGLELTRLIRGAAVHADPQIPNARTPIVMLTGRRRAKDVEEARLAGVNEFVAKPFTPAALLGRIQAIINKPRGFVVGQGYVGPDRRRRQTIDGPSPMRRDTDAVAWAGKIERDLTRRTIGVELNALSSLILARGGLDPETTQMCRLSMRHNVHRAQSVRDTAIEQAAKSLLRYIEATGPLGADAKVVQQHIDALHKLLTLTAFEARSHSLLTGGPDAPSMQKITVKPANAP